MYDHFFDMTKYLLKIMKIKLFNNKTCLYPKIIYVQKKNVKHSHTLLKNQVYMIRQKFRS